MPKRDQSREYDRIVYSLKLTISSPEAPPSLLYRRSLIIRKLQAPRHFRRGKINTRAFAVVRSLIVGFRDRDTSASTDAPPESHGSPPSGRSRRYIYPA